jgi:hypothetical protein
MICAGPDGLDLVITQEKTGTELTIPMHRNCVRSSMMTPLVGVMTVLVTHFEKPYTAPGFGQLGSRDLRRGALRRVGAWAAQGERDAVGRSRVQAQADRIVPRSPKIAGDG